ncbi:CAP domain-containing protein [Siminovitchia sp. FSL H7-0308]|uniref:CAP domain-containing protein n=1 Tax=Siminovitchia sp. FSL H7-0308 TaxID=2921432 RepID=UPI0030EDB461
MKTNHEKSIREGGEKLRTLFRIFILAGFFLFISFYIYSPEQTGPLKDNTYMLPSKDNEENIPDQNIPGSETQPESGLGSYIGKPANQLLEVHGKPDRKEPSAYDYEWWVYNDQAHKYMQVGVRDGIIVTLYVLGDQLDVSPYKIGQPVEDIYRTTMLETEIVVTSENGTYRLELSEEDLNMRPLIQLGDIFAQLSVDKFTGKLFSVRFLDQDTLVAQRSYELVYRGDGPQSEEPDDEEWAAIERGSERQIYDITNIFRKRFGLDTLTWDEEISSVAYGHSKDMNLNDYFDHESPKYGDLEKRLNEGKVEFQSAAENIAADYIDGPAAFEGWLNSENHRKPLLDKDVKHIGVGVYQKNYTQNFVRKK